MAGRNRIERRLVRPLATIDDIQRRLVRPSSLSSSIKSCDELRFNCNSTKLKENLDKINKEHEESTNKKLEDYLDPSLLSAVSSKIARQNTISSHTKIDTKKHVPEFEWPVNELKVFIGDSTNTANRHNRGRNEDVVNLGEDSDDVMKVYENTGDGDDESCSPFLRFEKAALKMFGE